MFDISYRMSGRKSNRRVTPTNRYGTEGGDAPTVAGDPNTTAAGSSSKTTTAKDKGKTKKKARRVIYSSSSDNSESSETIFSDSSRTCLPIRPETHMSADIWSSRLFVSGQGGHVCFRFRTRHGQIYDTTCG